MGQATLAGRRDAGADPAGLNQLSVVLEARTSSLFKEVCGFLLIRKRKAAESTVRCTVSIDFYLRRIANGT